MDKPAFKAAVDLYQDVTMEPVAATSKHTQQQHTSASTHSSNTPQQAHSNTLQQAHNSNTPQQAHNLLWCAY